MKIKIEFLEWTEKEPLEIEAENLKEAVEKAVAYGANLDGANLRCANLRCANLRCATLDGANLDGANLDGANLDGANLRCANLRCANLRCANLRCANLRCATLDGANLDGANLRCANLRCANLRCATLEGANLDGATLEGANLDGAKYGDRKLWATRPVLQLGPCGSVGRYTTVLFFADGGDPLIRCGCFTGDIDEFREKIESRHGDTFFGREYRVLADHIATLFAIQQKELKAAKAETEEGK